MCLGAIAFACWFAVWTCFMCGAMQIVDGFGATPFDGFVILAGLFKITFLQPLCWGISLIPWTFGYYLVTEN